MGFNNVMHAMHEYQAQLKKYKWEALISFLGEKERKTRQRGKKEKKTKSRKFARLCVELSPFMLSNTVYQRVELTDHIGPQSVYLSRALCIIVLRSQGSD